VCRPVLFGIEILPVYVLVARLLFARNDAAQAVAHSPRGAHASTTRLVFAATIASNQPQIFSLDPSGRSPAQLIGRYLVTETLGFHGFR
jgi:hypothetical protein